MWKETIRKTTLATAVLAVLSMAAGAFAESGEDEQTASQEVEASSAEEGEPDAAEQSPRLDVAFVVDATGSMKDEIDVIKKEIWSIANEIATGDPTPEVRFGLVFYRDKQDEQVVSATKLTEDVDAIHEKLMAAEARGGGDHPEHVLAGLDAALDFDWEKGEDVSRSIYLVGDASAHTDYQGPTIASVLERAKSNDIAIEAIGGSGIDNANGKEQFARLANATDGTYEGLTYHAVVEGEDGEEKSVIYDDGEHYEADEKLSKEEWSEGAEELKRSGRVERATGASASKAKSSGEKENNLDSVVEGKTKEKAKDMGVSY